MTQIAADALGFPMDQVTFERGDSDLPEAPISGGSQSIASVAPAVRAAALALREKLVAIAVADESSSVRGLAPEQIVIENGLIGPRSATRREPVASIMARAGCPEVIADATAMALMEQSVLDEHSGRIVNANLADYHIPTNADIGEIDVGVVAEDDPHINPLGARGIGEIGITGVAAAIANAVYHAVGVRVRELPITLDKLLV
jgi:xanthine dehydrogenase YagR molybdenum-binding subunit